MIKITESGVVPTLRLEAYGAMAVAEYCSRPTFNKGFRLSGHSEFGRQFNRSMNTRFPDVRYVNLNEMYSSPVYDKTAMMTSNKKFMDNLNAPINLSSPVKKY